MIGEFERMAKELDDQINAEQERTGIHDVGHFAYSTFAKAAMQRRDNLAASAEELKVQLAAAIAEREEAVADLEKIEAIAERDNAAETEPAPSRHTRAAWPPPPARLSALPARRVR